MTVVKKVKCLPPNDQVLTTGSPHIRLENEKIKLALSRVLAAISNFFIRARCKLRGLLVRDLEPRLRSLELANFSEDPITHRK